MTNKSFSVLVSDSGHYRRHPRRRRLFYVYACGCVCVRWPVLTQWKRDTYREKERREEKRRERKEKKIVHLLVLSINVASVQTKRKRLEESMVKKKKQHYVLQCTAKRSINRSTVAYLIVVVSFFFYVFDLTE